MMTKRTIMYLLLALVFVSGIFFLLQKQNVVLLPKDTGMIPQEETFMQLAFPNNTLDTSDWQTYRNEEFGFEVRYPKNIVNVSNIRVSEMKEMYEFGFYLDWHLGRVDIRMPAAKIGMNIYVYNKDVDTMFKMYSDLNKSPIGIVGSIPINNTNLLFLIANKDTENGDLFRYQRVYFAGDKEHAYEIVPTQIPGEHKKIFQEIISSFKLLK